DVGRLSNIGAAYIFMRAEPTESFSFLKKLIPGNGASSDNFGGAIAASGNTLVVGSCCHNVGRSSNQGTAYIFERHKYGPNNWANTNILLGPTTEASAQFGFSVATDGNLIAISSKLDDVESNKDQGAVYLFRRNENVNGGWDFIKQIVAVDSNAEDEFGTAVAVSGDTVVVGAPNSDVGENSDQGSAYIFSALPLTIQPEILSRAWAGADYFQPLSVNGGAAPYSFAITDGTLPSGLVLNNVSGLMTGVADQIGKSVFTITATDSAGRHAIRTYAVTTSCPLIKISPTKLPGGRINRAYKQAIIAESWPADTRPFTFKVVSGGLPQGLSLDSATGIISGRPSAVGTSRFTIAVTDAFGCSNSRDYSLRVAF
ncbi:MAG TPA: putative Ig domain-containing protein, partial [Blastocatellia bacterium]|nr:putative Ig domain-containing protein [Blastocatellia bacterium]